SGLRPIIARNHICCNIRYFLWSLGVLSDTTEFHAFSRHVRVVPCHSVATMRNIISAALFALKFCCFTLNKWFACCKDGLKAQ
ncbi:hypothetical protein, partial [Hoylesella timonensis]|uniref:hypothetical protein n=1 Tax=Hoylesella timonensis TaxID=386414 RepID=UPI001E3155C2